MQDVIGIEFFDRKQGAGAVITWRNVFDEQELLEVVTKTLYYRFGAQDIEKIQICDSLVEISDYPYFYECLISFMQAHRSSIHNKKWIFQKRRALYRGDEILFTGFKARYQDYLERKAQGFQEFED